MSEDTEPAGTDPAADDTHEAVAALADCEGWRAEDYAARVHYRGETDRYSVEFYAPSECVLYWKVRPDGDVAVPVSRKAVPTPLRERVRQDLAAADLDPDIEGHTL